MVDISTSVQPLSSPPAAAPGTRRQPDTPIENTRLRAESERFEAAFLAEMLRHSGLGRMSERFNGGAGEAAFAGALVQEYANRIAATGKLGIAERIYHTLVERGLK